jgi:hypothetical protein
MSGSVCDTFLHLPVLLKMSLYAFVAFACSAAARAEPSRITYFERLGELSIADATDSALSEPQAATLTVVAFGRQLDVSVERNDRLTQRLSLGAKRRIADVALYRGTVIGLSGSWVRLTRRGGTISGAIFDGTDLYAIEQYDRVAALLVSPDPTAVGSTIIYRWQDTTGKVGDEVADPLSLSGGSSKNIATQLKTLGAALSPGRQVDLGLIADSEFARISGVATESLLLNTFNIVDGIFGAQLGVRLYVAELDILQTAGDPFTSTNPGTLLAALADYKANSPALRDLGLVHLFTGRALTLTGESERLQIIGMANLGTLCDPRLAVSLAEKASGAFPELIVAHEIAHVFGASHDGQPGSVCQSTPADFLMAPVYNGSDQFSACTLQQMLTKIASATCVGDVPPNDLSVHPGGGLNPPLLAGREFSGSVTIDNAGPNDAFGIEVTFTAIGVELSDLGSRCSSNTPGTFVCAWYRLGEGQSAPIVFRGIGSQPGLATIDVSISSWNDPNPTNNHYRFDIDLVPAVDFATAAITASPPAVHPGETSEIKWDFVNTGPSTATDVELVIKSWHFDELSFSPPGGGTCTPDPVVMRQWRCPIGTMAVNDPQRFSMQVRAASSGLPAGNAVSPGVFLAVTAAQPQIGADLIVYPPVTIAQSIGDLGVAMSVPSAAAEGSAVEVTLVARNDGPDSAHDVALSLRDDERMLEVTDVTGNGANCVMGGLYAVQCTLSDLAAGSSFSVTIRGVARRARYDPYYLLASAYAHQDFDPSQSNNVSRAAVGVTAATPLPPAPPPPPTSGGGGGGGGGAADLASLLALLASLLFATRGAARRPEAPSSRSTLDTADLLRKRDHGERRASHATRAGCFP